MPYSFGQALDNGVKPGEISETITHLAFYSGFANAFAAVGLARDVFAQSGIGPERVPQASSASPIERSCGGGPRGARRRPVRRGVPGCRAIHDGCAVPRPLAAARSCPA